MREPIKAAQLHPRTRLRRVAAAPWAQGLKIGPDARGLGMHFDAEEGAEGGGPIHPFLKEMMLTPRFHQHFTNQGSQNDKEGGRCGLRFLIVAEAILRIETPPK